MVEIAPALDGYVHVSTLSDGMVASLNSPVDPWAIESVISAHGIDFAALEWCVSVQWSPQLALVLGDHKLGAERS